MKSAQDTDLAHLSRRLRDLEVVVEPIAGTTSGASLVDRVTVLERKVAAMALRVDAVVDTAALTLGVLTTEVTIRWPVSLPDDAYLVRLSHSGGATVAEKANTRTRSQVTFTITNSKPLAGGILHATAYYEQVPA